MTTNANPQPTLGNLDTHSTRRAFKAMSELRIDELPSTARMTRNTYTVTYRVRPNGCMYTLGTVYSIDDVAPLIAYALVIGAEAIVAKGTEPNPDYTPTVDSDE